MDPNYRSRAWRSFWRPPAIVRVLLGVSLGLLALASTATYAEGPLDFRALWDFMHPDSTEMRFRALLPGIRASGDTTALAELLTQIARTQGLQRRFDEAHRTLDEVEPLLRRDRTRARLRYLLERGRVFNSSDRPEAARALVLAAWTLGRSTGEDNLAIDAAHMVAITEMPDSAIAWNLRALALAETTADEQARGWLGSLRNNLAWSYHDRGAYEKALDLFRQDHEWRLERGREREARIAKWSMGRTLRSLGRLDEALAIQQELLAEWEAVGQNDGYVFEEMGECLHALDRREEARPWFARAHEALSQDPWLVSKEPARLQRLAELGGVSGE